MTEPTLPRQNGLDTVAFAKTLSATDTSYKYLWLLALLEILKEREYQVAQPIKFDDIFADMIELATAPVRKFKLHFGVRDQMEQWLLDLDSNREHGDMSKKKSRDVIKNNPAFRMVREELGVYPPSRWIRPFVEKETKGAGGKGRNQNAITVAIVRAAHTRFHGKSPPPYYINSNNTGEEIIIHEKWAEYFFNNAEVIKGWCLWHFAKFLQARNSNVPAIINKITADTKQERTNAITKQREFWTAIITKSPGIYCLYSNEPLTEDKFVLDHYVPWSFVGHDSLWNLVPAHPSVNSSKGDRLPDKQYLPRLIDAHHNALTIWHTHFDPKWKKLVESYISDLKLTKDTLTNQDKIKKAYCDIIPPLIDLAKANHFKDKWMYNNKTPLLKRSERNGD